jgi:glycosyltransferase involved in cell wall biosynthesis
MTSEVKRISEAAGNSDPAEYLSGKNSICILPRLQGMGGPSSFQAKLIQGLNKRGFQADHNPNDPTCRSILVVGGTSRFDQLIRARKKGLRIVQRLNGMNWIHRKRPSSLRYYLRCEINNLILSTIRQNLADRIVYQSNFACKWWQTVHGSSNADSMVVYNGVNLDTFHPGENPGIKPQDCIKILMVEAHISGGYEQGLENAVRLVQILSHQTDKKVELVVAGQVSPDLQKHWQRESGGLITWAGVLPLAQIPALDRSAHMLFSADLNAACPNSVIEALACGLPVLAFATGSLPELINQDTGRVVSYGSNYWNLEPPDVPALATAALEVLADLKTFSINARKRAEEEFGLDRMVEKYLEALI